jgi:hypothetical protein
MSNISIYGGALPPSNPGPSVLWLDESMAGLRIPTDPAARVPVMGSAFPGQTSTQEANGHWNPILKRWEIIANVNGAQSWCYSLSGDATGPYSQPVRVLGTGSGGEAGNSQQCHVEVTGTELGALYSTGSTKQLLLAVASMPADPANPAAPPVFTKLGVVATSSLAPTTGSPGIVRLPNGKLALFWERGGLTSLFLSDAPTLADLVATPFVEVQDRVGMRFSANNVRPLNGAGGRPQIFLEGGRLVGYHHGGGAEFAFCGIHRAFCDDLEMPVSWVPETQADTWIMRQKHQLEIDQCVDFRLARDEYGATFAFTTAADNSPIGNAFSILCTPVIHPLRRYGGARWHTVEEMGDTQREQDWINPDRLSDAQQLRNLWDAWANTGFIGYKLTLPPAASRARCRITNDAQTNASTPVSGNQLTVALSDPTRELLIGRVPIVSIAASGTTVTVTTKRPHGLVTTDKVTLTGHAPAAYNVANAAVTSTPSGTSFTYEAAAAPGASTKLGFYDRTSIEQGETFEYICSTQYAWVRR